MFPFGGFNIVFPEVMRSFQASYNCYSMGMLPGNKRQDVEKGGKIIMPPSALEMLTRFNVEYPMLFKLYNYEKERSSHAGVLEFIADEGKCYIPYWMMDNLLLEEGDILAIENVSLPVATFSKFQPRSSDFLDITNPKAVLENALRSFACLTVGDVIAIQYNHKIYELCVLETQPGNAVSIIECDMNVEFEAPVDSKNPSQFREEEEPMDIDVTPEEVVETFVGSGIRLDGKKKKEAQITITKAKKIVARGVPDYEFRLGALKFDRSVKPISDRVAKIETKEKGNSSGFEGQGLSIN